MDTSPLLFILQGLHLCFAIYWVGSLVYTEIILWPRAKAANMLADVQTMLRTPLVRRISAVPIIGTILTGYARGVVDGAFDRTDTPYTLVFVLAALLGTSMIVWWSSFPPRTMKRSWFTFYSSFWVIIPMMFVLRFS